MIQDASVTNLSHDGGRTSVLWVKKVRGIRSIRRMLFLGGFTW